MKHIKITLLVFTVFVCYSSFRACQDALFDAIDTGNLPEIQNWIKKNNLGDDVLNRIKWTPLHCAANPSTNNEKSTQMIRFFLQHGAHINQLTPQGHSALYLTAVRNNVQATQLLLENDADPNIKTFSWFTPLYGAICNAEIPMVSLLLQYSADVVGNLQSPDLTHLTCATARDAEKSKLILTYILSGCSYPFVSEELFNAIRSCCSNRKSLLYGEDLFGVSLNEALKDQTNRAFTYLLARCTQEVAKNDITQEKFARVTRQQGIHVFNFIKQRYYGGKRYITRPHWGNPQFKCTITDFGSLGRELNNDGTMITL